MRVLGVFSTDQLLGGGEVSFILLLKGLKDAGCETLALLPGAGPLSDRLNEVGIPHRFAPQETLRRGGSVRFLLQPQSDWLAVAREFHPDIIHCNAVRSALYGQAVGRALSIPVVFHARTAQEDPPFDHFLIAATRAIICTSQVVNNRFPAWFGAERRYVIPNPIDPLYLSSGIGREKELRREWLQGAVGPLIGVVGRLSPAKGQEVIVRAAPAILQEYPSCRFVLVGDEDPSNPGYEVQLRTQLAALGCEHAFRFAGYQSDMRSAYRALDIVAFPTITEGFGRIVIEAGASAKPVIATDLPVLREIIPSTLWPYLLADPDEFVSRLLALVSNSTLCQEIGGRLKEHVTANYGLIPHVERVLNLYSNLLKAAKS